MDRALETSNIDIFIIDVMLPDANGMNVARDLRQSTEAGIILLTGRDEEMDHVLGLELGADDYVTKPFRLREFRARVNAVYRRVAKRTHLAENDPTPPPQEALKPPGLVIIPSARTVHRDSGESVALTTMEFDVLIALASRPNRVLTRNEIMDDVRGPDWAAYDRAIDGVVSRLRRKLYPDDHGHEHIKTIRGIGYMLSA
jgi:DNA-binding response OmpR family regulator